MRFPRLHAAAIFSSPPLNYQPDQRRLMFRVLVLLSTWLLALMLAAPAAARDGIEVRRADLEYSDGRYRLALQYSFELTRALEDALSRGVPLYFTTEVQLTRPRWYWFDEKALRATRTVRVSYNVLTQHYLVSHDGALNQTFPTLEDALALVRRPPRWEFAQRDTFKSGEIYNIAIRMSLDVARLPKPIQVHAINSSDWRFASEWKLFSFRAE
jgi:hypothetical protein